MLAHACVRGDRFNPLTLNPSNPADRFYCMIYSSLPQDAYPSASRNRRLVILNGYVTITFILHVYVMHDTLCVIESFTEIPLAIEDS